MLILVLNAFFGVLHLPFTINENERIRWPLELCPMV